MTKATINGMEVPMIGKKFGKLTCIERSNKKGKSTKIWYLFKCDCGNERITDGWKVRSGQTISCLECSKNDRKVPMIGKTFNDLTVLKEVPSPHHSRHIYYSFSCVCGNEFEADGYLVRIGKIKRCQTCSNLKRPTGQNNSSWKGFGEISLTFWNGIGRQTQHSKHNKEITIEYAWDLFLKQDRKCALTGLEIKFSKKTNNKEKAVQDYEVTASLDRIDSTKGYVEGNVQWVHKNINFMKQRYKQDYFIEMCKLVAKKFS